MRARIAPSPGRLGLGGGLRPADRRRCGAQFHTWSCVYQSTGLCGRRASPARCARQPARPRLVTSHARRAGVCRYRHPPPPPRSSPHGLLRHCRARCSLAVSSPAPPARAARCVRARLACAGSLRTAPAFIIAPSLSSVWQRLSCRRPLPPLLPIPFPIHRLGLRCRLWSTPTLRHPRCEP